MKKIKVLICAVIIVTNLFIYADAQNNAVSQTNSVAKSKLTNNPDNTTTVAATPAEVTALIAVADTSPSVKKQLGDIKQRAKELISIAPAGTRIGIVGINWEATKKLFKDASSAEKMVDLLTVGGGYTDLGRGNDAGLSLVQEAGASRAAIVFLTDGKATVPATFKNRETFIEMLRREYASRPNIRVFVLNVKGDPLPADANLPPNVTFVAAKDWISAREVIAKELAPQIKTQLAPEKKSETPNSSATPAPVNNDEQSGFAWGLATLVGLALTAIVILPLYFWFVRERGLPVEPTEFGEPENILREEDISSATLRSTASVEAVLILQASRKASSDVKNSRRTIPLRAFVHAGERLIIGNSRFTAGFELPGLKQSQVLEIAFDGSQTTAFRLRPANGESLETVTLNTGENAPAKFELSQNEILRVGDFEIELLIADENVVDLIATSPRTRETMILTSPESNGRAQQRGGRFRRNGG